MEKQHTAFQAEEEQILADNGDKDEGDGDIELNDVSWGGTGSPRISLCDGDGDYGQPLVRRDHLVELANEERRFDFREELETMIGGSPPVTSPPIQPSLLVQVPGGAPTTPLKWRPSLWVLEGFKSAAWRQPT